MKALYLAPIALALALAGCGGKESFVVGGTVTGLEFDGLELTNGSDKVVVAKPATGTVASFQFGQSISYGDEYHIVIKNPPHQQCGARLQGGLNGAAGYTQTIDVALACTTNTFTIGGSVTGLDVDNLVVINGNGTEYPVPKNLATFTYPDAIKSQASYGLVIKQQPATKVCSIANGVGRMGDEAVTNIAITCVPK